MTHETVQPANILLFGREPVLLSTRVAIVRMDGFGVDSVDNADDLMGRLTAKAYRLLVLCHTLSATQRDASIALAASLARPVKLLALTTVTVPEPELPFTQKLRMQDGPAALRSRVRALVQATTTAPNYPFQRKVFMAQFQGTVKWFNNAKGYGFVGREGGPDVFTHYSSIQTEGYKTLREGDQVAFDVIQGSKGPQADQVEVLKKQ